jgi:chromate reductase
MACLNIPLLQHPEVYISHVDQLFDENGKLTDESTKEFLKSFMDEFAKFTAAIAAIK